MYVGILGYSLSYRDVEEMMLERGIRISSPLTTRGGVGEPDVKVKGKWKYLYRAV